MWAPFSVEQIKKGQPWDNEMLELFSNDFKLTIITMPNNVKKNMVIVNKKTLKSQQKSRSIKKESNRKSRLTNYNV